ncbi:MAG: glycosyltransferase family 39 protein [Candidatus Aureabacteria bacterium]|nr:glycosyltransferase family 39 protein [Candidatus Auribacterota bacterium]
MAFLNTIFMVFILWVASSAGRTVLGAVRLVSGSRLRDFVLSCGIGLGMIILFVSAFASAGLLRSWTGLVVLTLIAAIGFKNLLKSLREFPGLAKMMFSLRLSVVQWSLVLILAVAVFSALIAAAAPPTGMDSLVYHLNLPKEFIKHHGIYAVPFDVNALWPLNIEMLFLFGLLFKNAVIAKMFNFSAGVLCLFSIYLISRRFASKTASLAAAALFYLMPVIVSQSGYAYVDVAITFFCSLMVMLFLDYAEEGKKETAMLAGLFAGILVGAKFTNCLIAGVIFGAFIINDLVKRNRMRRIFINAVLFISVAVLVACHWYIRAYIIRGNPVFPFLQSVFGNDVTREFRASASNTGFYAFILTPFKAVFRPELYGGTANQIGPVPLAFLPVVVVAVWRNRTAKIMLSCFLAYYFMWFFVKQNLRFLLPGMVMYCPLIGLGLDYLYRSLRTAFAVFSAVTASVIVMFAGTALYYAAPAAPLFFGNEYEENYLLKTEPTCGLGFAVEKNIPEDKTVLMIGEIKRFYINRKTIRADGFYYMSDYCEKVQSEKDAAVFLKDAGVEYVISSNIKVPEKGDGFRFNLACLMQDNGFVSAYFVPIGRYEFKSGENVIVYNIYKMR